ncbi:MAG: hypothetical protein KAH00_04855 [Cocleimonas sp.]|nr:hypothetical protein [Cocleimonas sp.]
MRRTLIALSLFISTNILANPIWEDVSTDQHASVKQLRSSLSGALSPYSARLLRLDEAALRQQLFLAENTHERAALSQQPSTNASKTHKIINLPLPDGSMLAVIATEYAMMEASLADKLPQFKTWKIKAADGKNIQGRIDFSEAGFHAMLTLESGDTIFIDPDKTSFHKQLKPSKSGTNKLYNSFSKQKNKQLFQHTSDYNEVVIPPPKSSNRAAKPLKIETKIAKPLITYRLAVAATAEYTALSGGTKMSALSAILTTINRVNEIYERDLAIRFKLVANNDKIIYLKSTSDPFSSGSPYDMLDENIANMETVIGNANYDLGHLLGGAGTGGLALLSGACRANQESHKAGGITGSPSPYGDSFNIDYVSHEMGHQLGATHSFNSIEKNCSGGNREADTAVEPGSGSTVMSYAGICGADNLQHNSEAVFNAVSIDQINHYTRYSSKANCGVKTASNNNSPSLSIQTRFYIPINTPFKLSSVATDIDGDHLSYTWDQIDANGTATRVGIDAGDNPLFRSYLPSLSKQRYFPQLTTLFGGLPITGEQLALTNRDLKFATTVRDNKGGIARADTKITTSGKPFKVISQVSSTLYQTNERIEVRWNEAGTSWSPVNCNHVDIKLLTKEGASQDLLLKTPNDGSQFFTLPDRTKAVTKARIMVACSDNIFFALSNGEITIDQSAQEEKKPIASVNSPTITEGDSGTKTLSYLIRLNKAATQPVSIQYAIYDNNTNRKIQEETVNIAIGQSSKTISQLIIGNTIAEGDRTYDFILSSPQNVQLASAGNLVTKGTVIDNDTAVNPVNVSMNNISVVEGNSGVTKALFTINLNQAAKTNTTIKYETISDTARAGSDFASKSGTLFISAGKTSKTVSVDITADRLIEENETFWLLLSEPSSHVVLMRKRAIATIINDDVRTEDPEEKVTENDKKAGGAFDRLLTFFLIYLGLLKFSIRKQRR